MSHAKFPHILKTQNGTIDIVNDKPLKEGDRFFSHMVYPQSGPQKEVFAEVTEVIETRPAKGDWSNWSVQPTWHILTAKTV